MKAVLDTNVLVSGVFWRGPPFEVLKAWISGKFSLVASLEILDEYRRVLDELALKYPTLQSEEILSHLFQAIEIVAAPVLLKGACEDPDDDKFIAAAIGGKASYIVTGDKLLLKISGFQGITILTPQRYLSEIA